MDLLNSQQPETTSDERLFGMLSHLSVFLGGIILPIIIWATQKDKSKFVRFHSLQAIFFQIAFAALITLFVIFLVMILLISGIGLSALEKSGGDSLSPLMIIILIILYGGIFLFVIGGISYSVYLAVKTYNGYLIRIPFIGKIIYGKVYEQS